MFIQCRVKKINDPKEMELHAVFETADGVKYEERYKSRRVFLSALRRRKADRFVNAVDFESMTTIYPRDLT